MMTCSQYPTRIALFAWLTVAAALASATVPRGWELSSTAHDAYEAAVDRTMSRTGHASGTLRSIGAGAERSWAVLLQRVAALHYRRQRVRMTAYLRTSNVRGWSGLFMRVDPLHGPALQFDNMENRPITGTNNWKQYEIELDVPSESESIAFGALLAGSGQIWLDDVRFEAVGVSVPGTQLLQKMRDLPTAPVNLGFED